MTGGQAVPAANGPITQKQPVTLMQVSSYLTFLSVIIKKYVHIICAYFFHLSFSYLIRN